MHPKFDDVRGVPVLDWTSFRDGLLGIDSRQERVAFARRHGGRAEFRRSQKPGIIDIRIVRDDRVADAFECSFKNAPRILDRDEAGLSASLEKLDRENAVERFYARTQGALDPSGQTRQGRELAGYVASNERLRVMIVILMNPRLSSEQFRRAVEALNNAFDAKEQHHGTYSSFVVTLPCGQHLKIKVWQNMGNAMSFGWE